MTAPDPREARLPQWARNLLSSLRTELRAAEDLAQTAALAATVARERSTPAGCQIIYDGPDGEPYGLPGVSTVSTGDIEITVAEQGVIVTVVGKLTVEPLWANSIQIRSVPS